MFSTCIILLFSLLSWFHLNLLIILVIVMVTSRKEAKRFATTDQCGSDVDSSTCCTTILNVIILLSSKLIIIDHESPLICHLEIRSDQSSSSLLLYYEMLYNDCKTNPVPSFLMSSSELPSHHVEIRNYLSQLIPMQNLPESFQS